MFLLYTVTTEGFFLPDRWVMPAGRIFLGIGGIFGAVFIAITILRYG